VAKNTNRSGKFTARNSVPNLIGETVTNAQNILTNLGFKNAVTTESTGDSNLNNKVKSQDVASGEVAPLETTVNLVGYNFSFAPFSFAPFGAFGFTPFGFTPFGFTPFGFTPFGFTPFGFTPFGAFGFTPFGAFGFTPVFSFSPPKCIHEDTLIQTPSGLKPAKELAIGDEITSVLLREIPLSGEDNLSDFDYVGFESETLTSEGFTTVSITSIVGSVKNSIIWFNGQSENKYSLSQPFFIKQENKYKVVPSAVVSVGDIVLNIDDQGNLIETLVKEIEYALGDYQVYQFSCEPQDWFIAGNYLVHNK